MDKVTEAIVTAASRLAGEWNLTRPDEDYEIFTKLSCSEVEPLAELFLALGHDDMADHIILQHARGDDDEDDMHYALYLAGEN